MRISTSFYFYLFNFAIVYSRHRKYVTADGAAVYLSKTLSEKDIDKKYHFKGYCEHV